MAISKRNEFDSKVVEVANLAKSLSHPARIMIIKVLSKHKDRTCKEIVGELPLSQPTVSQHLKELIEAGLICRRNHGTQSLYCIEWNRLERMFTLYGRMGNKLMLNRPKRNCC